MPDTSHECNPVSPTSLNMPPPTLTPDQLRRPTTELYAAPPRDAKHTGHFAHIRKSMDWDYHTIPTPERQALQDAVVDASLKRIKDEKEWREQHCSKGIDNSHGSRPIALFTAGGMGAGKGHTLKQMLKDGELKLPSDFVWVDPDSLARSLPEREQYIRANSHTASKMLHPEAALLQEILSGVAKEQRRPLVIDGSLSDCGWFGKLMKSYREEGYACEILFVTAPEETMVARAERRAKATGRYTDPAAIKRSRIKSPECVANLSKPSFVQRVRLVDNSSDSSPAKIIYDSNLDPAWHPAKPPPPDASEQQRENGVPTPCEMEREAGVDVKGFVEGVLEQGDDGRVRRRRREEENGSQGGSKGRM